MIPFLQRDRGDGFAGSPIYLPRFALAAAMPLPGAPPDSFMDAVLCRDDQRC